MNGVKADVELDLKGEVCPFTFVKAKLTIEDMGVGQVLRVIVDYRPATKSVPRSMEVYGYEILGVEPLGGDAWTITIRKR